MEKIYLREKCLKGGKNLCITQEKLENVNITSISELLVNLFVHNEADVIVFLIAFAEIAINGVISGFIDDKAIILQWLQSSLFSSSAVYGGCDNAPTAIYICYITSIYRACCTQSKLKTNTYNHSKHA